MVTWTNFGLISLHQCEYVASYDQWRIKDPEAGA